MSKEDLISSETCISLKFVFKSNKDSLITDPKLGWNGFSPRIDSVEVTTTIYPDSNELNCTVQYTIVGIPAPTQEVDVLLFPARV